MSLSKKDAVGVALVVATLSLLGLHNAPSGHQDTHVSPVANARGSVTTAVAVPPVAFVDVNVVAMDGGGTRLHQVVVVRDGFVAEMGPLDEVEAPFGAVIVQGGGRYLAPGLTDAHVHLGERPSEVLELFVANGVTTVFNLEGDEDDLALRDRIRDGGVLGPTIYTAGPFVDDTVVRSPTDARRIVLRQAALGYDFVKVHGELSAEAYQVLSRTGSEEGIAIVGHAPRNLPFSAVLESSQAGVTHAEELIYTQFMSLDGAELADVADDMAAAGTWLTPALVTFENITAQWGAPAGRQAALRHRGAQFLPPSLRRAWARYGEYAEKDPADRTRIEEMFAFHAPLVRALNAAGVPLLAGTDAGTPGIVPGFSLHEEIVALNAAGLSRAQAFAAATSNAGRFIREHVDESASFGTVELGARADLVLLEGDPLQSLDAIRRPEGVMLRGRWYDRAALDRMLTEVAAGR